MLPDFGWSELLVIAIILIVVVGPKDLPKMLRTFGKTTASLRKMAGDFRRQFDDALKEAELDDVRDLAKDLKGLDPRGQIKQALSPLGEVGRDINKELKKAASEIEKSDKPAPGKVVAPAADAKAGGLPEPEPVNLSDAPAVTKATPAKKAPARSKASTTQSAAGTGAAKTTAAKTAAPKTAASKTSTAAKTAAAKPASTRATASKASASKAGSAEAKTTTRTRAKPKPKPAGTRSTAAKKSAATAAETTGKDKS